MLDNTVIAKLGEYSNVLGMLDLKKCRQDTDEYIKTMNIKTRPGIRELQTYQAETSRRCSLPDGFDKPGYSDSR